MPRQGALQPLFPRRRSPRGRPDAGGFLLTVRYTAARVLCERAVWGHGAPGERGGTLAPNFERTAEANMPTVTGIRPYRPDIDGLRSIAILAVLLASAGFTAFSGGDTGLSVFFVVSGYLLTQSLLGAGRGSIIEFYDRRVRRVLPALIAATAVSLVAGAILLSPAEVTDLSRSALASVALVSNVWVAGEAVRDPLMHTWSLSLAGQLFLILPLAALILVRAGKSAALPLVALATVASFAVAVATANGGPAMHVHQRIWEFAAGSLVALVPVGPPGQRLADVLATVGVAAIIAPILIYTPEASRSGAGALPAVLGTVLVLWANRRKTIVRTVLSASPFVFIGMISYSLYVWHWPMLVFSGRIWGDLGTGASLGWLAATIVVATMSWYFIEQPFRYPTGPIRSRGAVLAASVAGVGSVAVLAAAIASDNSVAGRAAMPAALAGVSAPACVGECARR